MSHNPITRVSYITWDKKNAVLNSYSHVMRRFISGNRLNNKAVLYATMSGRLVSENKVLKESVGSNSEYGSVTNSFRSEHTGRERIDLRKLLKNKVDSNDVFCSFELTPTKNNNFYQCFFEEMKQYRPLFYALTWHANNNLSLELLDTFPSNTLLHLIVNGLTRDDVQTILQTALDRGVTNIFALRGDSTIAGGDFPYAADVVRFIRKQFGDSFCICVAGYPEMHQESPSKEMDLFYLKEKVDAGADFIITQVLFEADIFIKFANDCKKFGINVPIIPGIFPIPDYRYLVKMAKTCNFRIPQSILDTLEPIKNDDYKVRNYGIELVANIVKDIIASGTACGFHLFTLNRSSLASEICDRLSISK